MNIKFKPEVEKAFNNLINGLRELGFDVGDRVDLQIESENIHCIGSRTTFCIPARIIGDIMFIVPEKLIKIEKREA
jgi:hypothetical protein